jgi:hypothetical protein
VEWIKWLHLTPGLTPATLWAEKARAGEFNGEAVYHLLRTPGPSAGITACGYEARGVAVDNLLLQLMKLLILLEMESLVHICQLPLAIDWNCSLAGAQWERQLTSLAEWLAVRTGPCRPLTVLSPEGRRCLHAKETMRA